MLQDNIIAINVKGVVTKVFQLSIFVAIVVVAPYFLNQLLTGSIVNALLFIAVIILGLESALFLCLIPSIVSIYTGLLPMALLPMIPFIIVGNILLVLTFNFINKKGFWISAIPAAFLKFIFIWISGTLLANYIFTEVGNKIMLMVSWPQLLTAIAGASMAFIFLKTIKKNLI